MSSVEMYEDFILVIQIEKLKIKHMLFTLNILLNIFNTTGHYHS